MRNALIFILILGVLVLGFLLIKAKNQNDTRVPWPETEPATQTNNYQNNQNNNQQTNAGNQSFTTYNTQDFSFQYDSSATVQSGVESTGGKYYLVSKPGGVMEIIKMVPASSAFEYCANVEMKSTTMNGKDFVYCNSMAEPATTYIYIEGGNALVIMNQGTTPGLTYSYINPATVKINNQAQNTNQTYTYSNNEFGFAVDFPHTDVQRSTGGIGGNATIFSFFNQNERVATIHVWSDPSFVNQMKNEAWTFIGNINVNGSVFEQYSQTVGGSTSSALYVIEHNNLTYQISTPQISINDIFLMN